MDEKMIAELVAMMLASGTFGSMSTASKKPDFEKFKAEAESKREEARKMAKNVMLADAKRNAEAAKALYDAYVDQGFNEVQAFELLKETFIYR